MSLNISRRMVQLTGWVTMFGALMLIAFSFKWLFYFFPQLAPGYTFCSGPLCEMPGWFAHGYLAPVVLGQTACLILLGIVALVYGNRIRLINRPDLTYYILTLFLIDLALPFVVNKSDYGYISRILFFGGIIHALFLIAGLIGWYQIRKKILEFIKPAMTLYAKIITIVLIVVAPFLLMAFWQFTVNSQGY